MNKRVLLVDDDENLLRACERNLRKRFDLQTALGGPAGLQAVRVDGPFAVVVSDMRMPGMDGIQFLEAVQSEAPDTVRMMLTGNADLDTAIAAVNDGNVFRFITKPCPTEAMSLFLSAGVKQYQLVTAERELLEGTVRGAVRVCTEILSTTDSRTHGQSERVRDLAVPIGARLGVRDAWEMEVAALLAKVGLATIPPIVTVRHRHGNQLTGVEQYMLARVPEIGHDLLVNIPRLDRVARIVLYSEKRFDGGGLPADDIARADIPLESRVIKIVSDFVELEGRGESAFHALGTLRGRKGWYDPDILSASGDLLCPAPSAGESSAGDTIVSFDELAVGDVLTSNVETRDGVLLVQSGNILTVTMLEKLRNFVRINPVREPLRVQRRPVTQVSCRVP